MNRFETKYSNSARAMDEALIYLLNDKDYDYITIKEICKKAGVNRSTFYLHYENIDDLLKESVDWMINDFFSYFDNIKANLPRDMKTKTTNELFLISKTYLIPYLTYIKEHKKVVTAIIMRPEILNTDLNYTKLYKHILAPILDKFNVDIEDRNYIVKFYIEGIMAIVQLWIKCNFKESIDHICNLIIQLIPRSKMQIN